TPTNAASFGRLSDSSDVRTIMDRWAGKLRKTNWFKRLQYSSPDLASPGIRRASSSSSSARCGAKPGPRMVRQCSTIQGRIVGPMVNTMLHRVEPGPAVADDEDELRVGEFFGKDVDVVCIVARRIDIEPRHAVAPTDKLAERRAVDLAAIVTRDSFNGIRK